MNAKSTTAQAEGAKKAAWKNIGKVAGVLGMILTGFAGGSYSTGSAPSIPPAASEATLPPAKMMQMAEDIASIKTDLRLLRDDVIRLQGEKDNFQKRENREGSGG